MYMFLLEGQFPGVDNFPCNSVWRSFIHPKVCAFMWTIAHKRTLTMDNLQRRGWSLANRCSLRFKAEETVNHIIIDYDFVKVVWSEVLKFCGNLTIL
ncbi:unnamed protein product [Linum trigynum]|uniref:Reverse transcriptase zinc-binding domain-containing protein n=1 Tax=Linum trigynum TaxID=586398 RepID=A0AAV2GB72_9ROSI